MFSVIVFQARKRVLWNRKPVQIRVVFDAFSEMGILTNPNMDDTNRFVKFLQGKGGVLGLLCYAAGIAWLVFLANAEYNLGRTFTEGIFI